MSYFLKKFLLIIVLLSLSNFDCQESKENGGNMLFKNETKYLQVGKGDSEWKPSGQMFGPQLLIFRSQELWKEKKELFSLNPRTINSDAKEKLDNIDFKKESILIFTFGLVGSTGYSLDVKKISVKDTLNCMLTSKRPAPNETTGAVMQHPFVMVIVEIDSIPNEYKIYIDDKLTDFEVHRFE